MTGSVGQLSSLSMSGMPRTSGVVKAMQVVSLATVVSAGQVRVRLGATVSMSTMNCSQETVVLLSQSSVAVAVQVRVISRPPSHGAWLASSG